MPEDSTPPSLNVPSNATEPVGSDIPLVQNSPVYQPQLKQPSPSKRGLSTNTKLYSVTIAVSLILISIGGLLFSNSFQKSEITPLKQDPKLQAIIDRGTIIVGTDATYPPMEYTDQNGKLIGYDIELAERIAGVMGVTAEIRNIAWDDLFTALEKEEIDIIVSGVTITEERKQMYSFTNPYLSSGQVILTLKETTNINGVNDLKGKRIAVQKETTNEEQAFLFTEPELVLRYESFIEATNALVAGEADAIFSDITNAKGIIHLNPSLKIAGDPFTQEQYGIVLRKNETGLLNRLDDSLETLRQQGAMIFLKQKWLE